MKSLVYFCLLLLPLFTSAQKKNCKFQKSTDKQTGKVLQMVAAPGRIGNFFLAKDGDSLVVSYARKSVMALLDNSNTNVVYLNIDSVLIGFNDGSKHVFKAVGSGTVDNNKVALKPDLINVKFGLITTAEERQILTTKAPTAIRVYGEKSAEYHDVFTEKQQEKYKEACSCILSEG
ncbi:hypothetical protein [Parasegetibacter sp. NRK P23]|uniref:hypothetical protein n=1 Tax=Parasegetibacter sp. NRK P23 TaxID=2942999 RepID=UPI0020439504|nr:hypothetical protein [Parasegetibacter sp. NRK P23]MCM5527887.1 hypothetical protein [Parasegetibacter sp. NRK P23]